MKLFPRFRSLRTHYLLAVGGLLLSGCWGWIPETPGPPGQTPVGAPAPSPAASRPAKAQAAEPSSGMVEEWYTVESGDTLFSIAWRSRVRVADLAAWNKLGDGSLILVGQRLRLTPPPGYAVAEQGGSATGSATAGAVASPAPGAAAGGVGQAKPVASAAGAGAKAAVGGRSAPPKAGPASTGSSSSPGAAPGKGKWRWPTQGSVDAKSARVRAGDFGIRIMGERGQDIVAADSGKVMYAGDGLKAYGLLVIVQHTPQWLSAYGHNEKILVNEGDAVRAGQPIATMGVGSGNAAMLHFEIRRNGKPVEPIGLLPPRN